MLLPMPGPVHTGLHHFEYGTDDADVLIEAPPVYEPDSSSYFDIPSVLVGYGGNDIFVAYSGEVAPDEQGYDNHVDHFYGGDGSDTVTYGNAIEGVTIDLGYFGTGHGVAYRDSQTGGTLDSAGSHQWDILWSIENAEGTAFDDVMLGDDQDNQLAGLNGADQIDGGAGDDSLFGGGHSDTLDGGAGDDQIVGGYGGDLLTGGEGRDEFVFNVTFSPADTVTDFEIGHDSIDLDAILAEPPAPGGSYTGKVKAIAANGGLDTEIWAKTGPAFTKVAILENTTKADVTTAIRTGDLFDPPPVVEAWDLGDFAPALPVMSDFDLIA